MQTNEFDFVIYFFKGHKTLRTFSLLPNPVTSKESSNVYVTYSSFLILNSTTSFISCVLGQGQSVNTAYPDADNQTALHAAAYGGHLAVVHIVLQSGSAIDKLDQSQNTPLCLALIQGHNDIVKYLVQAGSCTSLKVNFFFIYCRFFVLLCKFFFFFVIGGRWYDSSSSGLQAW